MAATETAGDRWRRSRSFRVRLSQALADAAAPARRGFRTRDSTPALTSDTSSATGSGSRNVYAARIYGLAYSALNSAMLCSTFAIRSGALPFSRSLFTVAAEYFSAKSGIMVRYTISQRTT